MPSDASRRKNPPTGDRRRVKPPDRKGNRIGKIPLKEAKGTLGPSHGNGANGNGVKKMTDLRDAVENGSYRVEPEKVADKIVKDAVREIRNRLR
jgi:anti-sigma28 factor (negative regulator of flagellin synthesis)